MINHHNLHVGRNEWQDVSSSLIPFVRSHGACDTYTPVAACMVLYFFGVRANRNTNARRIQHEHFDRHLHAKCKPACLHQSLIARCMKCLHSSLCMHCIVKDMHMVLVRAIKRNSVGTIFFDSSPLFIVRSKVRLGCFSCARW
jgi:hypothetical protein